MDQLRIEIAERSPCDATSCPSWDRGVCWLRAQGHPLIAEWLELTVAGVRRERDRQRLDSVSQRVRTWSNRTVLLLWSGRLGWSFWFGPLVLAYVGPALPNLTELREQLGPHGVLLSDDRVWLEGDRRWLEDRQPGVPLLMVRTLPGAQQQICQHLLREVGELPPHDGRPAWRRESIWTLRDQLPESRRIVSLDSGERLRVLYRDRARAREALAVVGPPELLSRWPEQGHWQPSFAPLPMFEHRYEQLGARCPELFRQLRAELEARPLSEAHTCPSWVVFGDWLLEQGEVLLAECLRDDLECRHEGEQLSVRDRQSHMHAIGPVRASDAEHFSMVSRGQLGPRPVQARSTWLGPFMLEYHDPWFTNGFGADELQAILGRHASFLERSRVHTEHDFSETDLAD